MLETLTIILFNILILIVIIYSVILLLKELRKSTDFLGRINHRLKEVHLPIFGKQGIQGIKGERGIQGIQGIKGDRGERGIKGESNNKDDST